jgi:DNA-binding transcriptional LysR family regulator
MDLRHVRTFVAVAELGTVSAAALRLRVAQPALSRHISDLEADLGYKLFDRLGRRLVLTSEGEQLLSDCRGLLNHATAVEERAQLLRKRDSAVLRVAAAPQHIESALSQFIPKYKLLYPNVQVRLTEAIGSQTLALLERGEVHLGQNLMNAMDNDDKRFAFRVLGQVQLLAAAQQGAPCARHGSTDIARLAGVPLLLLDSGFSFRKTFDAACRLAGLKPTVQFESRAPHTLLSLAEAGHGTAIIPSGQRTHRYDLRIEEITYRGRGIWEELTVSWDRRRPLPPHALQFCDMWVEHVSNSFPVTKPIGSAG